MKPLFVALGIALAMYVAYAAARGEVVAKSGPGARRVRRDESAAYFWCVLTIYAVLAIALIAVF